MNLLGRIRRHRYLFILSLVLLSWLAWEVAQEAGKFVSRKLQVAELKRAKGDWEDRPFARYRLSIEDPVGSLTHGDRVGISYIEDCRQVVEVDGDRVVKTLVNTCGVPPDVMEVFDSIERALYHHQCGPNGCRCDGTVHLDVVYDPEYGYPVRVRRFVGHDWTTIHWPPLAIVTMGGACTAAGFGDVLGVRLSVTPVQSSHRSGEVGVYP